MRRLAFGEGGKPYSFQRLDTKFTDSHKSQNRDAGMSLSAVSNQLLLAATTTFFVSSPRCKRRLAWPRTFRSFYRTGPGSFWVTWHLPAIMPRFSFLPCVSRNFLLAAWTPKGILCQLFLLPQPIITILTIVFVLLAGLASLLSKLCRFLNLLRKDLGRRSFYANKHTSPFCGDSRLYPSSMKCLL